MSKAEKLILKVFKKQRISFNDAEKMLLALEYKIKIRGSHHVFRKPGHNMIVIKKRSELLSYQILALREALRNHGYKKTI